MFNTKRLKRRDVLKGAAAAAGAVGVPYLVCSSTLGNVDQLPASERIGLAFIGTGGRGTGLLSEIAGRTDVEILAVCDVQRDRCEKAQAAIEAARASRKTGGAYRACQTYRDFREVLARDDVDAVVIAATEHWRPTICIMAAHAGKDIYTEKPLAITIKEGQAVFEAVRRYGCILQHGTQHRNHEPYRHDCEVVRSSRIGKITHAVTWVAQGPWGHDSPDYSQRLPLPDRETFDWDLWLGPAPWRPWPGKAIGWGGLRDFGQGSIGNIFSHGFDMLQWALGKEGEGPVEILPPDGQTPLILKYADGVAIHCLRTRGSWSSLVHGTEGYKYLCPHSDLSLRPFNEQNKLDEKYDRTPLGPNDVYMLRPEDRSPAGVSHVGLWLKCIRTRQKTNCNEEVAYRNSVVLCLIDIMDRLQRPLKYDPIKAEFPGDEEANRLLDTPKRAPWKIY